MTFLAHLMQGANYTASIFDNRLYAIFYFLKMGLLPPNLLRRLQVYAMFCLKLTALCVQPAPDMQAGLKTLINNRARFD